MTDPMRTNVLDYGDNLDILRRYLPDAAVDLVGTHSPSAEATYAELSANIASWAT